MKDLFGLFIILYCLYAAGIMLIAATTTDYYSNWVQFRKDLFIPFWRIIRESFNK